MATATTDTNKTKWTVAKQTATISKAGNGQAVGGTITLNTAGTYLDRNIEIPAATVDVPAASISKTTLGYGEIATVSAGFVNSNTTITNNIGAASVTATSGTIEASVSDIAGSDGKYSITGSPVATDTTVNTAGYVASSVGTKTKGSVGVSGSVAASTLSATSVTPGANDQTVTIGAGYCPEERTVTVKSAASGTKATLKNTSTDGVTYTDTSESAPVLVSGDYLYIDAGYLPSQKISLAKLVPDNASGAEAIKAGMLSTVSAYDSDGKLITGNIVSRGASDVTVSGKTVNVAAGYYSTTQSKSVATMVPTIGGTAMTSGAGTADTTSSDVSITIPVGYNETERTITASSITAALSASGDASAAINTLATEVDETNSVVKLTGSASISGTATAATTTTGRAVAGTTKATGSVSGTASVNATLPLFMGDYTVA